MDNLLDSSRLATGAVRPALRPVGYDEVVARALCGLDPARRDRVAVEVDERLPEVLADPGLLERVVANVVDNALRHGAGAPVALRASATPTRSSCGWSTTARACPTGRGRAPVRAVPAARRPRPTHGLGLGLSVARGFTEAMGGTLSAEDTPGGGLTMVISLPRRDPTRAELTRMTRVLVVDDDPQILRALRINLTARGYDVLTAADGGTGLRAAAERHPDVVVLDLGLPDLDGTDVIAELRGWSSVPIIVLSARTDSARQGARARRRRRRLRHQAVRHGRAAGPAARRRPPRRRRHAPATTTRSSAGDFTVDLAAKNVPARRRGRAPDPDRVGHPRAAGRATAAGWSADGSCSAQVWGPADAQGDQLPAGLPGPAAPQARARPGPPPTPDHRTRHGLPLPNLTNVGWRLRCPRGDVQQVPCCIAQLQPWPSVSPRPPSSAPRCQHGRPPPKRTWPGWCSAQRRNRDPYERDEHDRWSLLPFDTEPGALSVRADAGVDGGAAVHR